MLPGFAAGGQVDAGVARRVAEAWLAGGIVGLPTETVYGLAADAQDAQAVARIYEAKGRPADHPLIVHVAGPEALAGWSAQPTPATAERLAAAFWPGPLTVIVPRSDRAGDFITGGQDTVALRCPGHPVALACLAALVEASGDPARGVAAPSANRFGRVSPTRATDVVAEVGAFLDPIRDLVVDGGPCAVGVESTIVDCTATPPRVLRLGAISQADIDAVLAESSEARLPDEVDEPTDEPRAPGTLESHYAPHAPVVLVEVSVGIASPEPGRLGRQETPEPSRIIEVMGGMGLSADQAGLVGVIADASVATPEGWIRLAAPTCAEEYARDLYAALRRADELGVRTVVAVLPDPGAGPLAHAVRDRLARAAHGRGSAPTTRPTPRATP